MLARVSPAIYRPAFNGLLGFPPGCQGFGGEDKNTDLEVGVRRGRQWYHHCSGLPLTESNLHWGACLPLHESGNLPSHCTDN